ncbi:MAG: FAD-dependent oxidoreductase [Cyanobacteriota bacterium]
MKSANRKVNFLQNCYDMEVCYTYSQAYNEASRCLLCHDAPCSRDCPADTDPAGFIRKFKFRNVKGAIAKIKENNILGGVCGVVCPTDSLCQKACSKTEIDRPIEIGNIQRFLVEHAWEIDFNPIEKKPSNGMKVAIIGSGPAGLSCAAELAKEGFEPTIFEAKSEPGGVLRYGVPEFRLNSEFLDRELEDIKKLGVQLKLNSRIAKKDIESLLNEYSAIFIATGLWGAIKIDIPGFDLENIFDATEFLELIRTDKQNKLKKFLVGKNVAVMGGGSVAMDVANTCKSLGANKVYIIYRRTIREMPASKHDLDMARDNFVIIKPQSTVTEFIGREGKLAILKGIEYDWDIPGDFSPSNLRPVLDTEFSLAVDAFVFAIGTTPEDKNLDLYSIVGLTNKGLLKTAEDGVSTSNPKIFAGGDIIRGSSTVVEAVSDGKKAASQIIKSLCECKV